MCNIKLTETLNYSSTIHGAKKSQSSKWSLLKLFYFTALQVDHTHDEKVQQHCMKDCEKKEMQTGF